MKLSIFLLFAFIALNSYGFKFTNRMLNTLYKNKLSLNAAEITMPALSSTMTEGKIVEWLKNEGDKVEAGDVIMVVESDKADMDVEAFEDGYLAKIVTNAGESAPVGGVVALIADNEADITSVAAGAGASTDTTTPVESSSTPTNPTATSSGVIGTPIDMPALSSTMKEGRIVEWSKSVGDQVEAGDVLMIVESDKADMDVEAFEEGYLSEILVAAGDTAPVGSPVAIIVADESDVGKASLPDGSPTTSTPTTSAPVAAPASAATTTSTTTTTSSSTYTPADGVINATPSAKQLAKQHKVDISSVKGTGNFGRVTGDDILIAVGIKQVEESKTVTPVPSPSPPAAVAAIPSHKAESATPAAPAEGVVAMDGMQKAVAKNMEATLEVPIFRVSREIVTDKFDAMYATLKPKGVSVSAMLAKAVAMTIQKHPIVNAAYVEGGIKYNKDANVAMAVAIDGGLITPTIIGCQDMDIFSVGRKWRELVAKAKDKKLSPAEYSSGTFTISNLGMFGVQQFDAILPPGTGSILAIAASTSKVIQDKATGQLQTSKSMTVTITCDHRHIYGADAANFLKDLADLIENNVDDIVLG